MAHIHQQIDFTVEVFVIFKNKVLLRKHEKYGIWLSVGGHVELDEDPCMAAAREVKEEVGLDIRLWEGLKPSVSDSDSYRELIPPVFLNRHKISDTHDHVTMTYFAYSNSDNVIPELEDDRSNDWEWLTRQEILDHQDLLENVRVYALRALDELAS